MAGQTSFRVRTELNQTTPTVLNVSLDQTYDTIDILSLELDQANSYKLFESGFGVICGRVSCSGFGIPNAKIGVFIELDVANTELKDKIIYSYSSTTSTNYDGVVYNLLPNFVDRTCHADVGTFPNKRQWLDSPDTTVQIYEKYYQFTTTSGPSGDFMIICPSGNAILHCDVDLSDIGLHFSQTPVDMQAKGYPANLFDSPTKFKKSTNLKELSQLYAQDKGLYVYPYWGEQTEFGDHIAITRADFDIAYKLESYCIFMGGTLTDKGNNALNTHCKAHKNMGKLSELATTSGTINMIRKTPSGRVEQYQILGDQLINDDGVWCYQIPMNLDYVVTDEFGNLVPTQNPDRGIATRARVRFRFTLNDTEEDGTARKRCSYLVPNNPRIDSERYPKFTETLEPDYEFGTLTAEESYKDLFWNNVYTVKSYIPKLQVDKSSKTKNHTGIKWVSYPEDNNPFPFNSLVIKKTTSYTVLCTLTKIIIELIEFLNELQSTIGIVPCLLKNVFNKLYNFGLGFVKPFFFLKPLIKFLDWATPRCIGLGSEFCDDEVNHVTYYPGCGFLLFKIAKLGGWANCVWKETEDEHKDREWVQADYDGDELEVVATSAKNETPMLMTCIENALAQEYQITSFNFSNDWINGSLYFPLWYRKIREKKKFLFGLFTRKAKDNWCKNEDNFSRLRLHHTCKIDYAKNGNVYNNFKGKSITPYWDVATSSSHKFHEKTSEETSIHGIVVRKETMLEEYVYYYSSLEYDFSLNTNEYSDENIKGDIKLLFATDIVLLGNLKECNMYGIPQFFKDLESSTYNLPNPILDVDTEITVTINSDGSASADFDTDSTETGCDWGNTGSDQCGEPDGGLFYGIGCTRIEMYQKACLNLPRICEFGVSKDVVKTIENLSELSGDDNNKGDSLIPDGYVSYDELYAFDERSMFATMNANDLAVKLNHDNGLYEYDFHYLYPENFDGSLKRIMEERQKKKCSANYHNNYNLEEFSQDYYNFRMGERPYFYIDNGDSKSFPRYENSFYFYFGLKEGKTALNKFNDEFFAPCEDLSGEINALGVNAVANDWCAETSTDEADHNGYVEIDASSFETPYSIIINSTSDKSVGFEIDDVTDERVVICNTATYLLLTDPETGNPDYEYVNPENCQFNIPNGDYELTITDKTGSITSAVFSLKNTYLDFKTESTDFTIGNSTMYNESGSYDNIANKKGSDYGGTIRVYGISWKGDLLTSYRVTVYTEAVEYSYPSVTVCNGSITQSGAGIVSINLDEGEVIFAVPYGNAKYKVTVTELCGSNCIDSKNSVSEDVYVKRAEDYRLYINDIDYALISHWTAGYSNSKVSTSGEVKGWLAMSSKSSYNWGSSQEAEDLVEDIISTLKGWEGVTLNGKQINTSCTDSINTACQNIYWDFEQYITNCTAGGGETFLTSVLGVIFSNDFESGYKEEIIEEICELLSSFNDFQSQTITTMKSNFQITCEDYTQTLSLSAIGADSQYPFTFRIWGREEMETEVEEDSDEEPIITLANDVSKPEYLGEGESNDDEGVSSVSSIAIPTLTTTDSELYGNESSPKLTAEGFNNLCLGYDNRSNWKNKIKFPYSVAVIDSSETPKTLPLAVGKSNFNATKNSQIGDYFVVHFIDKLLQYDFISWSYFDSIPKYKPEGEGEYEPACPITFNGFFTGIIKNGIVTSINSSTGEVTFDEQTFNNKDVNIFNIQSGEAYEDQMPTIRVLVDNDDNKSEFINYQVYKDLDKTSQCIPVPNKSIIYFSLMADDCTISYGISGNLKVSIQSYVISGNNIILSVSHTGGNGTVTYYFYRIGTNNIEFPLNNAEIEYEDNDCSKEIISASINMKGYYEAWNSNTDSRTIFSYYTTIEELKNMSNTNVQGYITNEDDKVVLNPDPGFGTEPLFAIDTGGNLTNAAYFIVAVDENNTRALSPVYDFSSISLFVYKLTIITTETNPDTGEITTTTDYGLCVSFVNSSGGSSGTIPYYLRHYESTITFGCPSISEINNKSYTASNFTYTSVSEGTTTYIIVSENTYNNVTLENITVNLTDAAGLSHECTITNVLTATINIEI